MSDRFKWGGSFAQSKLSIICWALSPNALSAHSLSSSKKSGSDFVLGWNVSFCHLCLAVACESGLTYFHRKIISTSSRVFLFGALIFRDVWSASFRK